MYKKFISTTHLKVIAIIAMTINHVGYIFRDQFHPEWWEFTYQFIGKLTFPIMAYSLVKGYTYTHNKKNYLLRLLGAGVVSILPFHLAFHVTPHIVIINNIMFTLSIGLIMLMCMDKYPLFKLPILVLAMLLTSQSDWGMIGVVLIYLLYQLPTTQALLLFSVATTIIEYATEPSWVSLNMLGILLVIPLLYYHDPTTRSHPSSKWFFYWYYPIHLLVLASLHALII